MRPDLDKIFRETGADYLCDEDCPYLISWVEEYEIAGAKESELEYGCRCLVPESCPKVQDKADDLRDFIDDNREELELLRWT